MLSDQASRRGCSGSASVADTSSLADASKSRHATTRSSWKIKNKSNKGQRQGKSC